MFLIVVDDSTEEGEATSVSSAGMPIDLLLGPTIAESRANSLANQIAVLSAEEAVTHASIPAAAAPEEVIATPTEGNSPEKSKD